MKQPILLCTAATLVVGAQPAFAATLTVDEVVVEGSAASSTKERVEGREIRETPAKDLGEALQHVPGMDLIRKGPIASDVVLRGQYRDNLNVLVDGQRLHGSCGSRMDPPAFHIDFGEVERVEIQKGPYDVTHAGGPVGTVNVVTKAPRKGFGADLTLQAGSFQSLNGSGTLSYGGEQLNGLAGYAYKRSQMPLAGGGKSYADLYPANSPNAYRPGMANLAYDLNTAWLKVGLTPAPDTQSRLDYTLQDARNVLYPGLTMDAPLDTMHRLNWTLERGDTNVQAYWHKVDHLMDNRLRQAASASAEPPMSNDARNWLMGAKVAHAWEVAGGVLKAGLDGYSRNWNTVTTMRMPMGVATSSGLPDVTLQDVGLYGEYAYRPMNALMLKAGLRGDYARTQAAALDQTLLARFTPYYAGAKANTEASGLGGHVQATYDATERVELFAGLGRAVRMPDPQEQFQSNFGAMGTSWIGNPTLRPIKHHQVDLGARYRDEWLNLSASVFGAYAQDYIYLVSLAPGGGVLPARTYSNQDAQMMGGEVSAQAALPLNLFLSAGLDAVQAQNLTSGNPLAETPPVKGTVALRYDVESYFVEAAQHAAAAQERLDPTVLETVTPGWMRTDLKAGVKWNGATLLAGVNNLFDAYYTTDLAYRRDPFASGMRVPEPGRTLYAGLSYRF